MTFSYDLENIAMSKLTKSTRAMSKYDHRARGARNAEPGAAESSP